VNLVERVALWLDARFRDAHREPETTPAKRPPGRTCARCDATEPEAPCVPPPAAGRYELDSYRWLCGACGEPCEPPAVPAEPR
jgi:hypothetical protein